MLNFQNLGSPFKGLYMGYLRVQYVGIQGLGGTIPNNGNQIERKIEKELETLVFFEVCRVWGIAKIGGHFWGAQ